jgi:hypothetical protein
VVPLLLGHLPPRLLLLHLFLLLPRVPDVRGHLHHQAGDQLLLLLLLHH